MTPTRRASGLPLLLAGAALLFGGCRGQISSTPPIHLNQNMDFQEKFEPQEANPFFADGRANRIPVAGTVARGFLNDDARFYAGREAAGGEVATSPVAVTRELLLRGQQRYNIYCAVCHGRAGDGQGIIMTGGYGYTPAPSYHEERLRAVTDGYLFNVITNGVRSMPGYAQQVPVADRWAITAYIRALQRSQAASATDLPADVLRQIEQTQDANIEQGSKGQPVVAAPDGGAPSAPAGPATGGADSTGT